MTVLVDHSETIGITEQMHAEGLVVPTYQFRDRRDGLIAEFDFGLITLQDHLGAQSFAAIGGAAAVVAEATLEYADAPPSPAARSVS